MNVQCGGGRGSHGGLNSHSDGASGSNHNHSTRSATALKDILQAILNPGVKNWPGLDVRLDVWMDETVFAPALQQGLEHGLEMTVLIRRTPVCLPSFPKSGKVLIRLRQPWRKLAMDARTVVFVEPGVLAQSRPWHGCAKDLSRLNLPPQGAADQFVKGSHSAGGPQPVFGQRLGLPAAKIRQPVRVLEIWKRLPVPDQRQCTHRISSINRKAVSQSAPTRR